MAIRRTLNVDRDRVADLTLMLLWLTSWEEEFRGVRWRQSWRGYDLDILDALAAKGLLVPFPHHGQTPLQLTDDGITRARELAERLGVQDVE